MTTATMRAYSCAPALLRLVSSSSFSRLQASTSCRSGQGDGMRGHCWRLTHVVDVSSTTQLNSALIKSTMLPCKDRKSNSYNARGIIINSYQVALRKSTPTTKRSQAVNSGQSSNNFMVDLLPDLHRLKRPVFLQVNDNRQSFKVPDYEQPKAMPHRLSFRKSRFLRSRCGIISRADGQCISSREDKAIIHPTLTLGYLNLLVVGSRKNGR
nr:hypothetical protein Iba_chr02bCG9330 [Ipomoea batatas]